MIQPIDEVIRDLFNGSVLDGTLAAAGEAPMSYDGTWRRSWLQLRRNTAGSWLQALDWYMYVDFTGTDAAEYKWLAVVHNRVVYKTVDEIIAAWKNGTFVRSPPVNGDWATRKIKGNARDLDDRAGPRTVQFDGPRYRLDEKEDYITWMGWAFYLSFERDMGVHLWDINFRGERIIYELAPQEAMAQYSGDDPHQASTVWLDGAFGMGSNVREVILGYDCPADAILLNATVHEQGSSTRRNAICVFERESGRPLSRHTGWVEGEMGAVKGYELVVRSVSTVGNYDYIFDYTFQLDGTIEIRLSASGYLQGGLWKPEQAPYGHSIGPDAMGSLHDHIINYKIDFDIAGTANSFMSVALEMEDKDEAWFNDDWGPMTRQQRLVRRMLPEESLLNFPQNAEGAYVVTNEQAFNTFGNPRGYTIHPGPLCHLTNLDAKRTENNVNWAKHHLAVSRRKDTEPKSSSMWNMNLPGKPPVNFYNFFDNETISQEDLVVWLNLGTHHIPRAEDSPNTLTNIATSYVLLAPWNFNDYDVSLESRNSVLLDSKGQWVVQEAVKPKTCVPEPPEELTYHGVEGYREDGTLIPQDTPQYQEMLVEMNHGLRAWNERAKNL
ncbi:copper amine oxidase [Naematelia encephala]|uniref:Amine oxidase n=1 Tax=Naematelia encephala TaxID=71784 RepID=A0A1Y2ASR9_9TREE|nr:copper amine oxidase [Naematelia encephala]